MVLDQLESFELMFLAGVLGGVVIGFYRAIRRTWPFKKPIEYLADILFCIAFGGILVGALFYVAWASIRLYTLLGFALGTWCYEVTVGKFVLSVLTGSLRAMRGFTLKLRNFLRRVVVRLKKK
ncbi:MAG TPA: hypothetical protein GXX40_02975 [Firmicutes bacterium]|nr:hypothetical protein [Bacillota bacterium]